MGTGEKCIAVTSEEELNELCSLDPEETETTSGKIIPLSKRFDDSKQDLRYKKTEGTKNKNALDSYDQKLINNWKNSKRIEIYTDEASMKKSIIP